MSYSNIADHRSMVFDTRRNKAYVRALKKVITPDTVVMDLGAGLGVHGLNAARLGAAKVLLVEPANIIEVAREVASDNGLDNVQCFPSRVEELGLEDKVDVIVSVFTGNFLLSEDLLPSLFYARDKFLTPGGQLIPDRARMEVVPVYAPEYYQQHVQCWSESPEYCSREDLPEVDFSPVQAFAANTLYYDSADNFRATFLAQTTALMEMDLNTATSAVCDSEIELEVSKDGICHGWLGWFQMHLVDEWLSTGSDAGPMHWSQVFLPLEQPLQVVAGEILHFAVKRPEFGEWTWSTRQGENRQRQSTFLSQPLSPQQVLKASDKYQPKLNERGWAAQWLLAQMVGNIQVDTLADHLYSQFPGLFSSTADALKFVKQQAESFS